MSLINFLTRIHFADRVLEDALPVELARLRLNRVLLLTDEAGSAAEPLARLMAVLSGECELTHLQLAAKARCSAPNRLLAKTEGLEGVIGFGGPFALCAALIGANGRRTAMSLPVLAIPTTSASVGLFPQGQAGEAGQILPSAVPSVVLCDPTLTQWAGRKATVEAAVEALSGCIESLLSAAWNPPADGIALDGIARIAGNLQKAVAEPGNLEARRELLAAGLNAGLAGQKGRGAVAALVRALQHHAGLEAAPGALHAALLPRVLEFNAPAVGERARALGSVLRLAPEVSIVQGLSDLLTRHQIAAGLGSLGLRSDQIANVARLAAADPATGTNPRLASEADYSALLTAAL